jgi:ribonucleotide reductase alpha subunit
MQFPIQEKFELTKSFIEQYKDIPPKWGFNGLGEFVYMRTYSRLKSDGKNEMWYETVQRVVEGLYTIQKQHIKDYNLGWNQSKAQKSAQEMYERIFNFKMLPPGRSLWALGTSIVMERGLTESLYNCSFLSTKNISENPGLPFGNAMDFLMLGVGVGFDVQGAGKIEVKPQKEVVHNYQIPDTREGWVESTIMLINSFFGSNNYEFDYSIIRPAGSPIRTFGGISAGAEPLIELHNGIYNSLTKNMGSPITARTIADMINMVGRAVVSGNVRRSAEIVLGNPDEEFLNLKNYSENPDRAEFGWASNNSIYAELGMDYKEIAERIRDNAEPGVFWKENAQAYSRIRATEKDYKDKRVEGLNPCGEITLEPSELCNLVEMFPNNHDDLDDFKKTIKYAYLYAKTITLLNTNWAETNKVMLRNRRIGLSMTGVVQFISKNGMSTLKKWMREGYSSASYYDEIYSDWFAIPKSKKLTTIKPSGTVSLLAGATPGIHYPESKYYIRRVRLASNSPYVEVLKQSGYNVELANEDIKGSVVVEFPVSSGAETKTINEVSMWEQLNLASFAQENWADNSVSVTITFKKEEANSIESALDYYQFKLKAVSFLPKLEEGAYAQMPYEEITSEKYEEMLSKITKLDFTDMFSEESLGEKYCSNDGCSI